jgi:hypothetical protein
MKSRNSVTLSVMHCHQNPLELIKRSSLRGQEVSVTGSTLSYVAGFVLDLQVVLLECYVF